jgi:hypothetical protein
LVPPQADAFAGACLGLLHNPQRREQVCRAAAIDAQRHALDNLVERFLAGIEGCLSQPRLAR